ncbi:MAG: hypothetical protein AT715_00335 [Thermoproteus sp. JCHS_4]|jgi:hypothetical protein|nr:MAG: hypothetical protein AT715_00335 [Thermoproteus sp. JCHS_4]
MTCVTKGLLAQFYGSLDFSLRALIHYRTSAAFGKPLDYFIVEEPWRVLEVLEKSVGVHNAELILRMLADWLRRRNCDATIEELRRMLSDRAAWTDKSIGSA